MARKRQVTIVIDNCMTLKQQEYGKQTVSPYRLLELTHTRVTGNTHIRVFIITLTWVLKAVSNK